jgi:hypothetical protein
MKMKSFLVWCVLPLFLVFLLTGRRFANKFPPYESGLHNSVVEAQTNRSNVDSPHLGSCPVFPKDNVWNTPVDKLPKDARSQAYIQNIGTDKKLRADWGSDLRYGIPFTEIPPGTKGSRVTFEYADESDLGNYPVPPNVPIEGGVTATGDRHAIFIDPRRCVLYEFFSAYQVDDTTWKAGSGIKVDMTSNAIREAGKGSADAAGLPIFPGLVRYDEIASGEINHALRFTVTHTQATFVWPARHKASRITDPNTPPMGERFRLRADFDISGYSKTNQVILKALKRYGMLLADNGASVFISGVADKRWDDDDLKKLGGVTAADLEAVDESSWQMLPESGRVDPLAYRP